VAVGPGLLSRPGKQSPERSFLLGVVACAGSHCLALYQRSRLGPAQSTGEALIPSSG